LLRSRVVVLAVGGALVPVAAIGRILAREPVS